jgi:hypothetical protein
MNRWQNISFKNLPANSKLLIIHIEDNQDEIGEFELSMKELRMALNPLTDDQIRAAFKEIQSLLNISADRKKVSLIAPTQPIKKKAKHECKSNGFFNLPFADFWNLYSYKVGDKKKCEKVWNFLTYENQKKILTSLPDWKKNIIKTQSLPYPETYLNQERWNDETTFSGTIATKAEFPDTYSKIFESKLTGKDVSRYWAHLRSLGYVAKRDNQQTIVDWVKAS